MDFIVFEGQVYRCGESYLMPLVQLPAGTPRPILSRFDADRVRMPLVQLSDGTLRILTRFDADRVRAATAEEQIRWIQDWTEAQQRTERILCHAGAGPEQREAAFRLDNLLRQVHQAHLALAHEFITQSLAETRPGARALPYLAALQAYTAAFGRFDVIEQIGFLTREIQQAEADLDLWRMRDHARNFPEGGP